MLGEKIRDKRSERGLSVAELADRVGLDPAVLHLVEHDHTSPSVAVLRRIAAALHTPLFHFLGDEEGSLIVKQNRRRVIEFRNTGVRYELLAPGLHRGTDVFICHLPPQTRDPSNMTSHAGEKCILVLEGSLCVRLGPETHSLLQGDSIYFDSTIPHFVESGEAPTVLVTAVTPPIF